MINSIGKCGPWIIGLLLVSIACQNDLSEIEKVSPSEDAFRETARDVELLYSDSAVVRVRASGPEMMRYLDNDNPREEFTKGLTVHFFGANHKVNSELTSRFAVRYEGKQQITVRDSVVWISKSGEKLETEELIWDEKNKKVYSNRYVRITNEEEVIYGYGFEANQEFTEWRIKQIEGRIKVEE